MYSALKDKLRKGVYSKRFVKDLIFLDSVDSTNNYGLSLRKKKGRYSYSYEKTN